MLHEVIIKEKETMSTDDDIIPRSLRIHSNPESFSVKENVYLNVRQKEGRLYSNSELRHLPDVPPSHELASEWKLRKRSLQKLLTYFSVSGRSLSILDLGCGNGWMSNALTQHGHYQVYAMDVNMYELEQGYEVFGRNKSLHFIYGDIFSLDINLPELDAIVIASAIQYFPDPSALVCRLFDFLKPGGEIHIIDSNFYDFKSVDKARARSMMYYSKIGYPEMAKYYHHHLKEKLAIFKPERLDKPVREGVVKIFEKSEPVFPWYRIRKP